MKEMDLLKALGDARPEYVEEAGFLRPSRGKGSSFRVTGLAASLVLVVMGALLLGRLTGGDGELKPAFPETTETTPVQTVETEAAETTEPQAEEDLIAQMFPPRTRTILGGEGLQETITEVAVGTPAQEVEGVLQPGYVLYYDYERYYAEKEGDTLFIRSIYGADDLPVCQLQVTYLPQEASAAAAQDLEALKDTWQVNWEEIDSTCPSVHLSQGQSWDSPVQVRRFIPCGESGCYRLISQYFLEAAEGHGVRFANMENTFQVLWP